MCITGERLENKVGERKSKQENEMRVSREFIRQKLQQTPQRERTKTGKED